MAGEKKIRVVVVDDEPLARESVVMLLARDAGVEVVGEFGGGAEAVEGIRRLRPELEEELDEAMFVRIHRSTIVRMERVRGLRLNEGGEYDVLMECGTRLRLSRRYRRAVQERMGLVGE